MPPRPVLVDTSVAVPLVTVDHTDHRAVTGSLAGRRTGLAGHAAFETYSVLTRLPAPTRRSPRAVLTLLASNFPESRFLPEDAAAALLAGLAVAGVAGGAVYDALIGAVSAHHKLTLLTRDARAVATYRLLDARYELIT